jgi:hypothetical protein
LLSSVTAPVRAKRAPELVAPVFAVMLASARMFPLKLVVVPSVAELPTCQNATRSRLGFVAHWVDRYRRTYYKAGKRIKEESWDEGLAARSSPRGTERTRTSVAPRASASRSAQGHSWDDRQQ